MKLQDQIDIIQAFKDGRDVTYISMYDYTPTRVYDRHSFDFVRNTYTAEPLCIDVLEVDTGTLIAAASNVQPIRPIQ